MPIKIILADDHQIVRQGLRMLLTREPDMMVVGESNNGRDAVSLSQELAPDVIIMDISMPELNGLDATRQIVAINSRVKIIGLSMHSDSLFVLNMLRAGACGYLLKECGPEELVQAIRTVMREKSYISPGVSDILIKDLAHNRGEEPRSAYTLLSPREREVLQLMAEGRNTLQIAKTLSLSSKTVEAHRKQIMNKVGIDNVAELTKYAIRQGLTCLGV